jgi:hypothetical protein
MKYETVLFVGGPFDGQTKSVLAGTSAVVEHVTDPPIGGFSTDQMDPNTSMRRVVYHRRTLGVGVCVYAFEGLDPVPALIMRYSSEWTMDRLKVEVEKKLSRLLGQDWTPYCSIESLVNEVEKRLTSNSPSMPMTLGEAVQSVASGWKMSSLGDGLYADFATEVAKLWCSELSLQLSKRDHKAEMYDEVWALAKGLGHGNVTDAITTLNRRVAQLEQGLRAAKVEAQHDEAVGNADLIDIIDTALAGVKTS